MAGITRILKLIKNEKKIAQGVRRKNITWTCVVFSYDFSQQSSSVEVRAVDRRMSYHLSREPAPPAPQALHIIISAVTALHIARGFASSYFCPA